MCIKRQDVTAVSFVKSFVQEKKPIAAICHGPWTLIEAGGVVNRKMTSWPSLKTDLQNAGATWVDQEVIVDRGLVTSRKPEDLAAFTQKMIEEFKETSQMDGTSRASIEEMPELQRKVV